MLLIMIVRDKINDQYIIILTIILSNIPRISFNQGQYDMFVVCFFSFWLLFIFVKD